MPGSGEIGGGSCTVKFRANGVIPTASPNAGGDAEVYDSGQGCPFDVIITVGNSTGQPTPLQAGRYKVTLNAGDEVKFRF